MQGGGTERSIRSGALIELGPANGPGGSYCRVELGVRPNEIMAQQRHHCKSLKKLININALLAPCALAAASASQEAGP